MNFATATELMHHQEMAVAKLLPSRVGALFMDMGTGKSRTLIELAKIRQDKWDRFFWFCPVSGKETIRHELLKHTNMCADDIYTFDHKTNERSIPNNKRFYIVGIESMSSSDRIVLTYNNIITENSFVAVDESQYIKGHNSNRTKRITHMSTRAKYRALLTGTPFSQGAVDLYSQMTFLSPKILGYRSFYSFARNHLEYEERKDTFGRKRRTGHIVRSHNEDYLASKIAPYVYQVKKDECLTLPKKLYETRYCNMTWEQRNYYEEAKDEILNDLEYDDFSPIAIFHLFTTLQAIICGFWNRKNKETGEVEHIEISNNRLPLLLSVVSEIPKNEPMIIWAKYHHAINQISKALSDEYGRDSISLFHGMLSQKKRSEELARWRKEGRFLIATQDTGGQVHTFNEAAYSIFYADSFKYDKRRQAEDRNHRIGQERRPVYITLHCNDSIDSRIATALENKGNALNEFQKMVNVYRDNGMKNKAIELVRSL